MRYAVELVDELEEVRNLMGTDLNEAREKLQGIINGLYTEGMEECM